MRDVDRALADIANIRSHLAAGTMFRGFGPVVMAVTGLLSIVTAGAQSIWPGALAAWPAAWFACWVVTALLAAGLVTAEMVARSHRHHGGLADAMILQAIHQFLPAGIAGGAIGLVLFRFSPESLWLLPGLWQILVALGLFASLRTMPRAIALVGGWYFLSGFAVLILASGAAAPSPWLMGIPFAIGQFLMAGVLHFASAGEGSDA